MPLSEETLIRYVKPFGWDRSDLLFYLDVKTFEETRGWADARWSDAVNGLRHFVGFVKWREKRRGGGVDRGA